MFSTVTRMRSERLVRLIGSDAEQLVDTYHDKIRETVLGILVDDERRNLHLRLAEVIEARTVTQQQEARNSIENSTSPRVFDLAYHFYQAGDQRAFKYQLEAGEAALNAYAFSDSIEHFRKAEEVMPTDENQQLRHRLYKRNAKTHERSL